MRLNTAILVVCLLFATALKAQLKVVKQPAKKYSKANFAFGYGRARSVVYLNRNVKQNNDARGHHFTLMYGSSKQYRFCAEYTNYQLSDIAPTWYHIKANVLELNLHYMARFANSKAMFYPLVGLSYNVFKGYFTGKSDFLNLQSIYQPNSDVVTRWPGLNVGTGFEFYIKRMSVYGDYKMRVGVSEGTEHLNIMDVCFTIGLRYTFRGPALGRLFKDTRKRYFLSDSDEGNEWY